MRKKRENDKFHHHWMRAGCLFFIIWSPHPLQSHVPISYLALSYLRKNVCVWDEDSDSCFSLFFLYKFICIKYLYDNVYHICMAQESWWEIKVIVDLLEKLYSTAHLSCFARLLQREPVDLTVHSGTSVIALKKNMFLLIILKEFVIFVAVIQK